MFSNKFVSATKERNTLASHLAAPYMRKSIEFDTLPESLSITVCGLGFYDIFINGKKITKGLLAPYISNPNDICYYDKYDLMPYIKQGRNVVGFILGNGFKNNDGGAIWNFDKAEFVGPPQLAFAIEGIVSDREILIEADETVKVHSSPIIFDDLRAGTHYDARLEIDNWCSPDFDDSNWDNAYFSEIPQGMQKLCQAEPIAVRREIKAITFNKTTLDKTYKCHPNFDKWGYENLDRSFCDEDYEGYVYDFGVNTAGVPKIILKNTTKGQKIEVQLCEFLNEDNQPSYKNQACYFDGYVQRDIYICKGAHVEEFIPPFTYHGFRYAFINGLRDEQAKPDTVVYLECSSDIATRGGFSCSDDTLNRLYDMVCRSDISNFYYFPTDCPHREKNGWTGDAVVSCEHMLLSFKVENSLKEWLYNVRAAQNSAGTIPGIVPTGGWGFAWGNGPIWDNVLIELPYQIYRYTGNTEVLKESIEAVYKYLVYAKNKRNEKGLLCYGLGDWVKPRGGKEVAPKEFVDSVMIYQFAVKAAKMYEFLGLDAEKDFAHSFAGELRAAIIYEYINDNEGKVANEAQTAYVLAIIHKLFSSDGEKKAVKNLVKEINDYGMHDCGMIGIRYLFYVLSRNGYADLAYDLIVSTKQNGYGRFVQDGFTTIPETFTYLDLEGKLSYMSLNHHFLGDISHFFISDIAGIRVNDKFINPANIDIAPNFIKALENAKAHFDSTEGRIEVSWERKDGNILLSVSAPNTVSGKIKLPSGYSFADGSTQKDVISGDFFVKNA